MNFSPETNILFENRNSKVFKILKHVPYHYKFGIAQSVTCLTANTCLTADPGVASSILARSHTFVEIDHKIISTAILLPSSDSRRVVVSYDRANACVYR